MLPPSLLGLRSLAAECGGHSGVFEMLRPLRPLYLSLFVLWDLAAEYEGGKTSTVIRFAISLCALGPSGGI